ncbi:MAG: GNAT family N-acetyltransferase [Planctomycetes bacterium]|nr:GNAT family N-acetyltransferase [Planctomycetota bacterium]
MAEMLGFAFSFDAKDAPEWFERCKHENLRVLADEKNQVSCLIRIPMGQWFGGKSVDMVGVAGVTTRPECRGQGAGKTMMEEFLREEHARGVALSSLYPSTFGLYRSVGYEHAGGYFQVRTAASLIPRAPQPESLTMRVGTEEDLELLNACYQSSARSTQGCLDRGSYVWGRIFKPRKSKPTCWLWLNTQGGCEAFLFVSSTLNPTTGNMLFKIDDACSSSYHGTQALLGFVKSLFSMAQDIRWHAGSSHPLSMGLADRGAEVNLVEQWMMRIVHLPHALEQRGWPQGLQGELHLAIEDELLSANSGNWVLKVENQTAQVERGGRGDLVTPIQAMAPLYSGLHPAESLASQGWLQGEPEVCAAATALFSGPAPGMPDMF